MSYLHPQDTVDAGAVAVFLSLRWTGEDVEITLERLAAEIGIEPRRARDAIGRLAAGGYIEVSKRGTAFFARPRGGSLAAISPHVLAYAASAMAERRRAKT